MTKITIPNSVLTMGDGVFEYWTDTQTIYIEAENKPSGWNSSYVEFRNWNYNCNANIVWNYQGEE